MLRLLRFLEDDYPITASEDKANPCGSVEFHPNEEGSASVNSLGEMETGT